MGAMFPLFAALATREPEALRAACRSAETWLLALAVPAIALLLGCADWLLGFWLGEEFRDNSTGVAHFLAAGILVNIVAQVPLTALNAAGRGDITAKIALIEFPLYCAAAWYCAERYGIAGVAAVWAFRAAVDAAALFAAANTALPHDLHRARPSRLAAPNLMVLCLFLTAFWLAGVLLKHDAMLRSMALLALMGLLLAWEWRILLAGDERVNFRGLWTRVFAARTQ